MSKQASANIKKSKKTAAIFDTQIKKVKDFDVFDGKKENNRFFATLDRGKIVYGIRLFPKNYVLVMRFGMPFQEVLRFSPRKLFAYIISLFEKFVLVTGRKCHYDLIACR